MTLETILAVVCWTITVGYIGYFIGYLHGSRDAAKAVAGEVIARLDGPSFPSDRELAGWMRQRAADITAHREGNR